MLNDINDGNKTWSELVDARAEHYGERTHRDTVSKGFFLMRPYMEQGWIRKPSESQPNVYGRVLSTSSDGSQVSEGKFEIENEEKLRDPEYLLKLHNYDPNKFELVNSKNSFWDTQVKGGELRKLYSSKVTVKPRHNSINLKEVSDHFENMSLMHTPCAVTPKQYEYGSEMLVICLFDIHFAKLASYDECGEKYDYKIARERVLNSIKKYIDRLAGRKLEKIVFPIGNDYFNSEADGLTTSGTPQSNDSRYAKMFEKGVETLIDAIDMLSSVAPVDVILVQGNHSFYAEYYASCVLSAWYKDSVVVNINNSPTVRKYIEFGNNLIGFSHGCDEKDKIFGLMQHEAAEAWGRVGTNGTREFLVGHLHSEGVTEKNGVVVRRIPTLCSSDFWHVKSGYTTSKKRTMAFIYDKNEGLNETHYINI